MASRPRKQYEIDIEDLSEPYVEAVARLHTQCFPGKIESLLGFSCIAGLLQRRYLSPQRDSLCRIAVLKPERRLAAYVCGVRLGPAQDWPYTFIDRPALRRGLLRRIWLSPRIWSFLARSIWQRAWKTRGDESRGLESTPCTEVVNMLAVHPECRGGNIAVDLMRDYELQARVRGARRLNLLVEKGNLRAERLYASLGWARTSPATASYAVFAMYKVL